MGKHGVQNLQIGLGSANATSQLYILDLNLYFIFLVYEVGWSLNEGYRIEVRDSENPFEGALPIWFILHSLILFFQ